IGLALWVSPYGWIAWGPRLALPLMPAALVAGLLGRRRAAGTVVGDCAATNTLATASRGGGAGAWAAHAGALVLAVALVLAARESATGANPARRVTPSGPNQL
ncbi:MAG: hypothetical protein ABIW46_09010, partial [Acidimicrobiales bacterium]